MACPGEVSRSNLRVLLVEDDERLAGLIQEYLRDQGIQVAVEYRGDRATGRILQEDPDLVILDLMLPGKDGLDVCREIRPGFDGPVLMLTARDEDVDQVAGLELGADDYVTKPVEPRVLLARIRALLRRYPPRKTATESRSRAAGGSTELRFGNLRISQGAREAWVHGDPTGLTSGEFDLLWHLAERAGTVLSRDEIYPAVRGIEYDGLDRWVDVRVSRLRKKLGDEGQSPRRIRTVWGQGYLFVEDTWE